MALLRSITKQLAGVEDLLFGTGTTIQKRGTENVVINKINSDNILFNASIPDPVNYSKDNPVTITEALTRALIIQVPVANQPGNDGQAGNDGQDGAPGAPGLPGVVDLSDISNADFLAKSKQAGVGTNANLITTGTLADARLSIAIQNLLTQKYSVVTAYADDINGGSNLSISTINANNKYTAPSSVGRSYVGKAFIKTGTNPPQNSSDYTWEERPGKIRIRLDSLSSPVNSGSVNLSQSIANFTEIEIGTYEAGYGTSYNKASVDVFATSSSATSSGIDFQGPGDDGGVLVYGGGNTITIKTTYGSAKLSKVFGIR